jgi:hypothetical protein
VCVCRAVKHTCVENAARSIAQNDVDERVHALCSLRAGSWVRRTRAQLAHAPVPAHAIRLRHARPHAHAGHLGCTPDAPAVNAYGFDDSSTYVSNNKSAQLGNFSSDEWFPANSSRWIVDHAITFINEEPSKPFYLNLWFHISHAPLNPSPDQLENFPIEDYCPWSGMEPSHMASNRSVSMPSVARASHSLSMLLPTTFLLTMISLPRVYWCQHHQRLRAHLLKWQNGSRHLPLHAQLRRCC